MDLSLAEQVALVVAATAAVRRRVPRIDGALVLVVAALLAAALAAAELATMPPWVARAVVVFVYAVGGVTVAQNARRSLGSNGNGAPAHSSQLPYPPTPKSGDP